MIEYNSMVSSNRHLRVFSHSLALPIVKQSLALGNWKDEWAFSFESQLKGLISNMILWKLNETTIHELLWNYLLWQKEKNNWKQTLQKLAIKYEIEWIYSSDKKKVQPFLRIVLINKFKVSFGIKLVFFLLQNTSMPFS